jgi:hypothetical protein
MLCLCRVIIVLRDHFIILEFNYIHPIPTSQYLINPLPLYRLDCPDTLVIRTLLSPLRQLSLLLSLNCFALLEKRALTRSGR